MKRNTPFQFFPILRNECVFCCTLLPHPDLLAIYLAAFLAQKSLSLEGEPWVPAIFLPSLIVDVDIVQGIVAPGGPSSATTGAAATQPSAAPVKSTHSYTVNIASSPIAVSCPAVPSKYRSFMMQSIPRGSVRSG